MRALLPPLWHVTPMLWEGWVLLTFYPSEALNRSVAAGNVLSGRCKSLGCKWWFQSVTNRTVTQRLSITRHLNKCFYVFAFVPLLIAHRMRNPLVRLQPRLNYQPLNHYEVDDVSRVWQVMAMFALASLCDIFRAELRTSKRLIFQGIRKRIMTVFLWHSTGAILLSMLLNKSEAQSSLPKGQKSPCSTHPRATVTYS